MIQCQKTVISSHSIAALLIMNSLFLAQINVSTVLPRPLSRCNLMGKTVFWAPVHHVMMQSHYVKSALRPSTLPELLYTTDKLFFTHSRRRRSRRRSCFCKNMAAIETRTCGPMRGPNDFLWMAKITGFLSSSSSS